MNQPFQARAEILKLARLLGCPPRRLDYLTKVRPEEIRELREQVTDLLFTAHETTFKRLAAASRLLPVGVVALIGREAFGPVLSARITGVLDPGRAIELAEKMPTEFLADVAVELDPRRATAVIAGIPTKRGAEITRELARREEFVAMGRFVGHLRPAAVQAALEVMSEGDLLRTAFVMEDKDRLDGLVDLIGEDRLRALVESARQENLWDELIDLVSHLAPERRAALAQRARETGFFERLGPVADALAG